MWNELQRRADRSQDDDDESVLYRAVLDFHNILLKAIDSPQQHHHLDSTILTACDHLRDVLRDQGLQVVDLARQQKSIKGL